MCKTNRVFGDTQTATAPARGSSPFGQGRSERAARCSPIGSGGAVKVTWQSHVLTCILYRVALVFKGQRHRHTPMLSTQQPER